ncbi:hypothetical protein V6N13_139957 [Hibiscus sabdariffa]|uniref:Uncharacterized protein n=2 Tax=Hibiscus sabdariffa TaxID=183260 RepID=A0ABR2QC07_9ROSI
MVTKTEALWVRDRLRGQWIYGLRIRVFLARREPQNQFWRRKRGGADVDVSVPKAERVDPLGRQRAPKEATMVTKDADSPKPQDRVRRIDGVESVANLDVLGRCLIGWCRHPISNSELAAALQAETIVRVRVMRISGSSILLIFDNVEIRRGALLYKWRKRLLCLPLLRMDECFLRLRLWSEIEERLELRIKDKIFPIRIVEADPFLRGPRQCCDCQCQGSDSAREHELQGTNGVERDIHDAVDRVVDSVQAPLILIEVSDGALADGLIREEEVMADVALAARSQGPVDGVSWRGNALWEVYMVAPPSPLPVLDTNLDLISVPIVEEGMIEGLVSNADGPVVEGSKIEIIHIKGSRRKVRLLEDVIQSVQPLVEKESITKGSKGRGQLRKYNGSSGVADISLSDSDLCNHKEVLLKEATSTVDFGKLLRAQTIGREDVIVQDITGILGNS